MPGLGARNLAQMALAQGHGVPSGEVIGAIPCRLVESDRGPVPLTLITEYPDETLQGAAFVAAHEAQRAAVIAAYEAFQALDGWDWPLV